MTFFLLFCLGWYIGLLFCLGWYIGHLITRKRILPYHDPNKPFTSDELRSIGIIPPEHYDEWLEEFAKR